MKQRDKKRLTNDMVRRLQPEASYYDIYDDTVNGFHVRVSPHGGKYYRVRYTLPNGSRRCIRISEAGSITADNARKAAVNYRSQATLGGDPLEEKQRPRVHTLESFLDEVYQARTTHRTAEQTRERVKACFPGLLSRPLGEIRPMWVENWRKQRLDAGKARSTVNRDLDALRGVLTRAVDWGFLSEHPLKRVKKFKLDSGVKPRYLSTDERKRLHTALEQREADARARRQRYNKWLREHGQMEVADLDIVAYTDHLMPMTLVALNTGLRRGELFKLEWESVSLDGEHPQIVVTGETAKSGRTRHIPLNQTARDVLEKWRSQSEGTGLVFPSPKTGGRMDNIRKSWKQLMDDAKITGFRFHDCRHDCASRMVQKGVDLNTVREILGHSDLKLTLRYAHLAPHNAASAVAILDVPDNVIEMPKHHSGST